MSCLNLFLASLSLAVAIFPGTARADFQFVSCTGEKLTAMRQYAADANDLADESYRYVTGSFDTNKTPFNRWFGDESNAANLATVQQSVTRIREALKYETIYFDCAGNAGKCATDDSVNAWVDKSNSADYINFCDRYFHLPQRQYDNPAGIVIHEISHFNRIAGTNDYFLTSTDAQSLARTNADKAVQSADNYQYFAEDHPMASCAIDSRRGPVNWAVLLPVFLPIGLLLKRRRLTNSGTRRGAQ